MIIDQRTRVSGKDFEKRITKERFLIFLLWLISKKEMHGYEIIKTIKSDKAIASVAASKLYPLLNELNKKGFVTQNKVMQGKRVRKVYSLTEKGRDALKRAKEYFKSSALMVQFAEDMLT
jgi:DNA-binding PadR family transcriptional regulator